MNLRPGGYGCRVVRIVINGNVLVNHQFLSLTGFSPQIIRDGDGIVSCKGFGHIESNAIDPSVLLHCPPSSPLAASATESPSVQCVVFQRKSFHSSLLSHTPQAINTSVSLMCEHRRTVFQLTRMLHVRQSWSLISRQFGLPIRSCLNGQLVLQRLILSHRTRRRHPRRL